MEEIESTLEGRIKELSVREEKFKEEDEEVGKIYSDMQNRIIRFNVGGKKFSTRLETLTKRKDHLLYKILSCKEIDNEEEIYLERSPLYFAEILNFLRIGMINMKKFTTSQLEDLLEEAEFFELTPLEELVKEELKGIKVVDYQISSLFYYNNIDIIGNPDLSVLDIPDSDCGFVANYPNATITFELDKEYEVEEIDIKGYTNNNQTIWNSSYGSGAEIFVSQDGHTWNKTEATIPYDFGTNIQTINFRKKSFRFIKFQHNSSYLGISYLKLKKSNK